MAEAGGAILEQGQVPLGKPQDQGIIFISDHVYRTRKTHLGHSCDVRRKGYDYRLEIGDQARDHDYDLYPPRI